MMKAFDLTGKADFLDIDQSFSEILFVTANPTPNSGSASRFAAAPIRCSTSPA